MTFPPDKDFDLFRKSFQDARPVRSRRTHIRKPHPDVAPHFSRKAQAEILEQSLLDDPERVGQAEPMNYCIGGLSRRAFRQLKRGRLPIEGELDLHGYSRQEAHARINEFMKQAEIRGWRCIRIVHGKGRRSGPEGPVLKGLVGRWLRMRKEVVAYCSARAIDGGSGALYVLLRHRY